MIKTDIKQSFEVKEPIRFGVLVFLTLVVLIIILFLLSFLSAVSFNGYFKKESGNNIRKDIAEMTLIEGNKNNNSVGLVVVPSSGEKVEDEKIKERIRNSFSDEVKVIPDETGKSGVIKPIFKYKKQEDYIYILVPVEK